MKEALTLSELTQAIKAYIYGNFPDVFWVVAEVSELHENRSGHCYLELAEKDVSDEHIMARMRAMIWGSTYRNLKPYFESATGYRLIAGIKIMVLARVEFHEVYGLSLNITDIDPSYTLGDLARKKQETINRLKNDGVFEMNKALALPLVILKIAVISSETAAGYGDFMDSLSSNRNGIKFIPKLFPAIMQGDKSEASVILALNKVFESESDFDVVVLIRGGGAQSELECFNSYELASHIAQFPIPLITGIGHERDETVSDLVAHTSLKTPTAVAEFIINHTLGFIEALDDISRKLSGCCAAIVEREKDNLKFKSMELGMLTKELIVYNTHNLRRVNESIVQGLKRYNSIKQFEITDLFKQIKQISINQVFHENKKMSFFLENFRKYSSYYFEIKKTKISELSSGLEHLNPLQILKRGFTITTRGGVIIKDSRQLNPGELIETIFSKGKVKSRIEKKS